MHWQLMWQRQQRKQQKHRRAELGYQQGSEGLWVLLCVPTSCMTVLAWLSQCLVGRTVGASYNWVLAFRSWVIEF
jgi:hypothetical protein